MPAINAFELITKLGVVPETMYAPTPNAPSTPQSKLVPSETPAGIVTFGLPSIVVIVVENWCIPVICIIKLPLVVNGAQVIISPTWYTLVIGA